MSQINFIVAMNKDHAIGVNNKLPWHITEDLTYFKQITTGCPILMGRKTLLSIGRVLPKRRNLVITRDNKFSYAGAEIYNSIESAIASCDEEQIFIIGGGEVFKQTLSIVDRLYITYVDLEVAGADAFFPDFDSAKFNLISNESIVSTSGVNCSFCVFERIV